MNWLDGKHPYGECGERQCPAECTMRYLLLTSASAAVLENDINRLLCRGYNFHGFTQFTNGLFWQAMFLPEATKDKVCCNG